MEQRIPNSTMAKGKDGIISVYSILQPRMGMIGEGKRKGFGEGELGGGGSRLGP